jgi:hypothetical protein
MNQQGQQANVPPDGPPVAQPDGPPVAQPAVPPAAQPAVPPIAQPGVQPMVQPAIPPVPQPGPQPQPTPQVQQPPIVQPAAIYSRCPGKYIDPLAQQFIDYLIERERKTYKSAVAALDNKIDHSPSKLQSFLKRVQERVTNYNWNNIINIILPAPGPGYLPQPPVNLISNYGQVSLEQVRNHANAYMGIPCRDSQNSHMLFTFLVNSLDNNAQNIMDIQAKHYTLFGLADRVCYLKVIITKAYVDTNATVDTLRKSIARLDDKIKELKYDIKLFNS